jgi:hypothetical protein
MQENNRTSFFDDDDLNITFEFRKPEKKDAKDLNSPPTLRDVLTRQNANSSTGQQGYYALHNRLLAYFKVRIVLFRKFTMKGWFFQNS